jgi:hypothetical protein
MTVSNRKEPDMRRSTTRPIRLAIALATGGALALTACGDDDSSGGGGGGGGGSVDAFCAELESFSASTNDDDDTFVADFKKVADAAPSEISAAMNRMLEAFERLDSLPDEPESEEQMAEMMELLEAIEEPANAVEEFAVENCPDLPDSIFGG